MSYRYSAVRILQDVLTVNYARKTILDGAGKPFTVYRIDMQDNSPDPGWEVRFSSRDECSTHLGPNQSRTCSLDEPLPEVWPDHVAP